MNKNKFLWTLAISSTCLFGLVSCGSQGVKGDKGDTGTSGTNGTNGKDGENGKDGASVLNGKGEPSSTLGSNGDSYIDTLTFDFYSKENGTWTKIGSIKGATGDTGSTGEEGSKGEEGTSIRTGKGEPNESLGNDGDSYINLSTFDYYVKENGEWSKEGNIKGEKGEQGDKGDKGNSGTSGDKGTDGTQGETAWSNTFLPSNYGYITPSAGSTIANNENTISFTVHHTNFDKYRCSELVLRNPNLENNGELVIKSSEAEIKGSDYTFTTTMVKGGFVVSANYATNNLKVALPSGTLTGGSISVDGDTSNTKKYFPGDKVTLKIELTSAQYRIRKDSFKINGTKYDASKLSGSGTTYSYTATVGAEGLKVEIEFEENVDLSYTANTNEDGDIVSYTVTGKGGFSGSDLVIPSEYEDKPVVAIANEAITNDGSIKSLTIPGSVKTIGNRAFYNCNQITSLTINNGVEYIGQYAFSHLMFLTSVSIPSSVKTIDHCAFEHCHTLNDVTIPEGVTSIGNYAFSSCWGNDASSDDNITVRTLKLPSTINKIGCNTFDWCRYLEKIILPKEVKTIEEDVFRNIKNLKIYYTGTKTDASSMVITSGSYTNVDDWYYYSETRPSENLDKQWCYDKDRVTPILWSTKTA